jgi:tetratricopeptide (TPR) repeat protein
MMGCHLTILRTLFGVLAASILATACATSQRPAPSTIEYAEDGSFTITQDVRVGMGTRSDFDAAVERIEAGDYQAAVQRLTETTDAVPQLASAHINLAIAHRGLEAWAEAESAAREAIALSPKHPVGHNELGMILRRQGRFEEARASYEQALESAPEFHFARRNVAILCDLFLADLSCALEHYERYMHSVPGDETVPIWIADLRRRVANGSTRQGDRR